MGFMAQLILFAGLLRLTSLTHYLCRNLLNAGLLLVVTVSVYSENTQSIGANIK